MPYLSRGLDAVFHALADPTRRSVVERLGEAPGSTSALAARYPMSLPAFSQHLAVLADAELIDSHKAGRVRTYHLLTDRFVLGEDWFAEQHDMWSRRLDRLDAFVTGPGES